ncbi:hypothetical protein [Thermogemmatispora tikiterensis]|uniref:DUF4386 domain-containing protein n=1 Tax=Thermogemmatispora tikiterensis TaxID=1825093 RepID=A0A328V8V5_9CHLR|nr:hypothetical protein [Thermogemmatispora tikiterensis]RAQ94056.1 hypothetical protein A4R35_00830 [Thermogemmatispora tikiterensis]
MNALAHQSQPEGAVPAIYRLHRLFLALCVVLGPLFALAMASLGPGYSSTKSGPVVALALTRTASATQLQISTLISVIGAYLIPVSLLTMAWLAMRRAPWLATIAMLVVFVGVFPLPAFVAQSALNWDLARMGNNPLFDVIVQRFNDDGVMSYYNAAFVVGTILGPALIGIALWRARVVPIYAAVLISASRLLVFSYLIVQSFIPAVYIQSITWLVLFIGSIPAALAVWKRPSIEQ